MQPHTRAMIAATAFAFVTDRKVAGLYDHAAGKDVRIAAERRGEQLQGFDGDRGVQFGGRLPEIQDAADKSFVSFEIDGANVHGYDRSSATAYTAHVTESLVQVYDHSQSVWFAYDVQDADAPQSYLRGPQA
jgi:hypothetical protein